MKKRILSLLLAAVMLCSLLPVNVLAAYDSRYDIDWSKVTSQVPGERVAQIAKTQIGYMENKAEDGISGEVVLATSTDDPHYYNKYYPENKGNEWCVRFVWWCMKEAGVDKTRLPNTGYVPDVKTDTELFTYYNCGEGYEPKIGDIAVYGFSGGTASHVEIITDIKVVNDGEENVKDRKLLITSVGGNTTTAYKGKEYKHGVGIHNTFHYYPNKKASTTGNRIVGIAQVHYHNKYDPRFDVDMQAIDGETLAERFAQIARSQVGYFENSAPDGVSGNVVIQTDLYDSVDRHYYNKYYPNKLGYLWNVRFVVWCARQAGIGENIIPTTGKVITFQTSCDGYTYHKNNGSYTPKIGDIVIWVDETGYPYTEIVFALGDSENIVKTVSGNVSTTYKSKDAKWGVGTRVRNYAESSADGYVEGIVEIHFGDEVIGCVHTEVIDKAVSATCTKTGLTEGKHCSVCNAVLVKQETVPVKAHSYSNGKCSVCGAVDPDYVTPVPQTNPFTDVKDTDWYCEAVLWAVENKITGGTSANTFSPEKPCTRAQVVTFLWAANGRPEPASTDNPFKDVKSDDWYYKAVLWAVEQGITGGTSANTFSPEKPCTRAQVVTFLYATAGKPEVSGVGVFTDVANDAWYAKPVIWAVGQDITSGIGDGKFGSDQTCTRGQIALFLYKAIGNK